MNTMRKPTAPGYYDRREAGRLLGAYRLLEAVLGEDAPPARDDEPRRVAERPIARRERARSLELTELVGR